MDNSDVRWIQRFKHFSKALLQMKSAIELARRRELSNLEQQGLIQSFEYSHELAWNTLKDFFKSKGYQAIYGSKDATRAAFKEGLIENGDVWMSMIESRNLTTHTYNENTALSIVRDIINSYFLEMQILHDKLAVLVEE